MTATVSQRLLDQLAAARRRLVETGTRNRLVHVNRSLQRANLLHLVNERADSVYTLLRRDGKRLRFRATLPAEDRPDLPALAPPADADQALQRANDSVLETPLTPETLARRLLRMANLARTAEEEQGVNLLYLAIGFLNWLEPTSPPTPRSAPLVLLPVELVRNLRTSTYDLRVRDEDISTNLPLQERLLQDFGLPLPDINEDEDWLPSAYLRELQPLIAARPGWSVEPDALQLGFFSFARLLMLNDLDPARWPQQQLLFHPLVGSLLGTGFAPRPARFDHSLPLDRVLDPAQLIHVVDADASQTRVIEEVRRGADLVVQGPPGTGKSQTIANIIAGAVHDGKTVLFVAEKMAALRVVYDRLVHVGLQDVCLELHARSANKKAVIEELGRALLAAQQPQPAPADPARLREQRDALNAITAALHTPLADRDYSPFEALAELTALIGRGLPPPAQRVDGLARLDRSRLDQLSQAAMTLATLRREDGLRTTHPFYGVQALDLQPPDLARILRDLADAVQAIDAARVTAGALPADLGLARLADTADLGRRLLDLLQHAAPYAHSAFNDLQRWSGMPALAEAITVAEAWQQTNAALRSRFRDSVLDDFDRTSAALLDDARRQPLQRLHPTYQQACRNFEALLRRPQPAGSDRFATAAVALSAPPTAHEQLSARLSDLLTQLQLPVPRDSGRLQRYSALLAAVAAAPPQAAPLIPLLWPHCRDERLSTALLAHHQWQQQRLELEQTFSYAAWSTDVSAYRAATLNGAMSFFARFGSAYRRAGAILAALMQHKPPRDPSARVALYDRIIAAQQQRALLTRDEALLQQTLQHAWQADRTDFARLSATLQWLQSVRSFDLLPDPVALQQVLTTCDDLSALAAACGSVAQPSPADDERLALRLQLLQLLEQAHALRSDFRRRLPLLAEQLADEWRGAATDCRALLNAIDWFQRAQPLLPSPDDLRRALALPGLAARAADLARCDDAVRHRLAPLAAALQIDDLPLNRLHDDATLLQLRDRLQRMREQSGRYSSWALRLRSEHLLQQAGITSLAALIDLSLPDAGQAHDLLRCLVAEARWQDARLLRPELEQIARNDRHALVRQFRAGEEHYRRAIPALVIARHRERLAQDPGPAMAYLRGEIARKRRHKAIRQLMEHAGPTVQRIKPVFLMSPISVAQFLPAGSLTFDLLLIDEASQVRPEEALGAVARARQIVVVGDQQQLPPTSFFERLADDDDDDQAPELADGELLPAAGLTDMESILTLCEARGLHRRMLEWHYRSRVPSLIHVSNAEFYRNQLVLPPSPLQHNPDYGMVFHRVDGVYHPRGSAGRGGTNRSEAAAVVAAAVDHARRRPQLSLGIVAFSQVQRDLLVDLLDDARRSDAALDRFMAENRSEPLFVKNIENVQGDERDVILISVGYGPSEPGGRLASMNFGPINAEGGARRLNVLFSRARVRCDVFASFDPDQIDLARTSRDGPRVLKRFLQHARDDRSVPAVGSGAPGGPFEQDLAAAVQQLGSYHVDQQLGSDRLRIDLAVRSAEPDQRYLLAVVGDGANYHAAAWARERDRLHDAVLSGLGWRVHRVWATDWYYRRDHELKRLREALTAAATAAPAAAPPTAGPAAAPLSTPPDAPPIDDSARAALLNDALRSEAAVPSAAGTVQLYRRARVRVEAAIDVHEAPHQLIERLLRDIIEQEGPLHSTEIARRTAAAFGKERTGARISEIVSAGLLRAQRARPGTLLRSDAFWMTPTQRDTPPVRDRRLEPALLKAELLPPLEIRAAALLLGIHSNTPGSEEIRAVARLLGFQRISSDISEVISRALQ